MFQLMRDQAAHGQAQRNRSGTQARNGRAATQFGFDKDGGPDAGPTLHHRAQSGQSAQGDQHATQAHPARATARVLSG